MILLLHRKIIWALQRNYIGFTYLIEKVQLKWFTQLDRNLPITGPCFKLKWMSLSKYLENMVLWALTDGQIDSKNVITFLVESLLVKQQMFVHEMWKKWKLNCSRMQSRIMKKRMYFMPRKLNSLTKWPGSDVKI